MSPVLRNQNAQFQQNTKLHIMFFLNKSTDAVSRHSVRICMLFQNGCITVSVWESQFMSIIFNGIGFIFIQTSKLPRWRNKSLVRIIFAGMSGPSVWDTYILHSWAIGNTERRETAGGSTAVTSPVKTPSHNLTMAWPDNTVTTPVQTNKTQRLPDRHASLLTVRCVVLRQHQRGKTLEERRTPIRRDLNSYVTITRKYFTAALFFANYFLFKLFKTQK